MKILSKAVLQVAAMGVMSAVFVSGCSSTPNTSEKITTGDNERTVESADLVRAGSITFNAKSYNLIVGGTWGQGVLSYKGQQYNFRAKSIGAGYALGVKSITKTGTVYNLNNVSDFAGTYYGVKVAGTLGAGAGTHSVQNSKGVVIDAISKSKGVAVDASAGLARFVIEF